MRTAHEKIRVASLIPTAPFELLLDPDTEFVIVTWPDLPAELSILYARDARAPDELVRVGPCPYRGWVRERLGPERSAEIEAAVNSALDKHAEHLGRVEAIHEALRNSEGL